jgi:DNA polymerase elongation subunit (family B)
MIHWWEYDENGVKQYYKQQAPLYFYMEHENGEYTSIYGDKVRKVEFNSIKKFNDTRQMFKDAGRKLFESDISPVNRFILDNWLGQDIKIPPLDILFIDIEVHSETGFPKPEDADGLISVITVWSTKRKKYYIFSIKPFDTTFLKSEGGELKHYVKWFDTEEELLLTFIKFIRQSNSDIISGWNVGGFDIPYIINRGKKILGERKISKLSPVEVIKSKMVKQKFGGEREVFSIAGINCIDYLDLYKKYTPNQKESYKLGYIGKLELNQTKLEYEGSLADLFHNDWQKYVEYNVQDVNLLVELDKKLGFINIMLNVCYNCRIPFEQFDKVTKFVDGALISKLMVDKIVMPDVIGSEKNDKYGGAYVHDPDVGLHEWLLSYDATSLYPSIMMQHNISPETKVGKIDEFCTKIIMRINENDETVTENEKLTETYLKNMTCEKVAKAIKENGWSIASNGAIYRHDIKGVVPTFVEEWFNKRTYHKNKKKEYDKNHDEDNAKLHDALQYNYKILINSVYGYLGTEYSRLYDLDNAVAVTLTGQEIIKNTSIALNSYFNNWEDTKIGKKLHAVNFDNIVTYNDTDSVVANSKLRLNANDQVTIEELFDKVYENDKSTYKIHYNSNREFVFPTDVQLPYYDNVDGCVKYGNVHYIERHKVSKPIYKVKTKSGKFIELTKDHTCMILNEETGELLEKSADMLNKGDKIITIKL